MGSWSHHFTNCLFSATDSEWCIAVFESDQDRMSANTGRQSPAKAAALHVQTDSQLKPGAGADTFNLTGGKDSLSGFSVFLSTAPVIRLASLSLI